MDKSIIIAMLIGIIVGAVYPKPVDMIRAKIGV